jgi:hypothetical protein
MDCAFNPRHKAKLRKAFEDNFSHDAVRTRTSLDTLLQSRSFERAHDHLTATLIRNQSLLSLFKVKCAFISIREGKFTK